MSDENMNIRGPDPDAVFRRTWTDAEELLKEKSFFILFFLFLSEFVIRHVQTNIISCWLLKFCVICFCIEKNVV